MRNTLLNAVRGTGFCRIMHLMRIRAQVDGRAGRKPFTQEQVTDTAKFLAMRDKLHLKAVHFSSYTTL